jgi:sugar lactone lactonase YvrE
MMDAQVLDNTLPLSQLGEGAFWDKTHGLLYWVDIVGQRVHSYDPRKKTRGDWMVSKPVSFVFPSDGALILGLSDGVYDVDPGSGTETPVALLDLPSGHRLNDGKLDPEGRVWVGTINTGEDASETAALYVLRNDRLEEVEGGYVNANGKGWSPDGTLMYHADTSRNTIWIYDFDLATGSVSNKRVFAKTQNGSPDGLCVGDSGELYVAMFGGGCVQIYSPRGEPLSHIDLPVPNVTSCALGGEGGRTLFITTAWNGMSDEQRAKAPLSGQIFVADLEAASWA